MSKILAALDGYKNYIFGAFFIIAGGIDYVFPTLGLGIGDMDTPTEFVTAGVAWILGRNALKKLEA